MGNSTSVEHPLPATQSSKRHSQKSDVAQEYTPQPQSQATPHEPSPTADTQSPPKAAPGLDAISHDKIPHVPHTPFQMSVTEPINTVPHDDEALPAQPKPSRPVPVETKRRTGWVSSTGSAGYSHNSPLGSMSSSTSSSNHRDHRESISGPYYRARGMSINREPEEDDSATTTTEQSPTGGSGESSAGVPTIITWTQGGQNVYVTGTFNGWKHKIKLVKSTHDFGAVLELPPGTHRLKFIVDDEWKCSNDLETATDPDGNLVNYLQVMDEDEDHTNEFDTLEQVDSGASTPSDAYGTTVPAELEAMVSMMASPDEGSKRAASDWERRHPQPPGLPPHLEKVLLNAQGMSEQDNSILPEPNHVTLNHLYACSIKDQVMALSSTTRYRKKYVTTMYYRPVTPK